MKKVLLIFNIFIFFLSCNGVINEAVDLNNPIPYIISSYNRIVSAGDAHSYCLNTDGSIYAWGYNSDGQIGNNNTGSNSLVPVLVHGVNNIGYLSGMVSVDAGYRYGMALKYDGTVYTWGDAGSGKLGINDSGNDQPVPVQVHGINNVGYLTQIITISAGTFHSMAIKNDRSLYAWGNNYSGQLGTNNNGPGQLETTPVQVHGVGNVGYLTDIVAISAANDHSLAVKSDGTVFAWGNSNEGRLGNNDTTSTYYTTPVQVHGVGNVGFLTDVVAIASGISFSVALKSDGTVYTWGDNAKGQLGNNNVGTDSGTPVQVRDENDSGYLTDIVAIAAGYCHCLALSSNGTLYAWGSNDTGQVGNGLVDTDRAYPVVITVLGTGVKAISAGGYLNTLPVPDDLAGHSLVIAGNNKLYSWGENANGQVGIDSTTTPQASPVQVLMP